MEKEIKLTRNSWVMDLIEPELLSIIYKNKKKRLKAPKIKGIKGEIVMIDEEENGKRN